MISFRLYPALILSACLAALGTALITQYGFGLRPCILCLYQRIPYVVAGVLSAAALLPVLPRRSRLLLVGLCGLAFAIDCGIAVFHIGVEHHWWEEWSSCSGAGIEAQSIESLQALLESSSPVRCDLAPWQVFGISMAGYNALFSLALTAFTAWSLGRMNGTRRRNPAS